MWMTPKDYHASYGLNWMSFPHAFGEIALLHLLAADLKVAKKMLEQAGRQTLPLFVGGEEKLLIAPDERDGFVFIIGQQPIEMWRWVGNPPSGEMLKLAQI